MRSFFDPGARAALLARVDRLTPDHRPRWGRMDVGRMLCHLSDALRAAGGEVRCAVRPGITTLRPVRWLLIHVVPWPRSAPTAPQLLLTPPSADLEADKARFRELAGRFAERGPAAEFALHPLFGDLPGDEWGYLMHRHVDHHLRQFGV